MNKELHEAARKGDLPSLMVLIQQGADINECGPHRWPLLLEAAHSGNSDVVRWLLENGADANATERDGKNVLHHAAMRGHTEVVSFLLKRGYDPNVRDGYGEYTPLHLTAAHASRTTDQATAAALLDNGASIDARNNWGLTALMNAAIAGRQELITFLLSRGADIDAHANDGTTALILVIRWGFRSEAIGRLLLEHGAKVEERDAAGRTALMWAVWEANTKITGLLLEYGASKNLRDGAGKTALDYADGPPREASFIGLLTRKKEPNGSDRSTKHDLLLKNAWQQRASTANLLRESSPTS